MYRSRNIAVVIPAYNEERLIQSTLRTIPSWVDRIIVVDDNSRDATASRVEALEDTRIDLIRHHANLGVGGAIVTGYRRALACHCDVTAVMGADGQMDPAELNRLIDPIVEGEAGYVKGNRLTAPELFDVMPRWRIVGNFALSMLTRVVSGYWHLLDSQCGFTAISREALGRLDLDLLYPRYGFPNDLLAQLRVHGVKVLDRDVRPIYATETSGIVLKTAVFALSWVLLRALILRLTLQFITPSLRAVRNSLLSTSTSTSGSNAGQPMTERALTRNAYAPHVAGATKLEDR